MKSVLITGAKGFLGSNVSKHFKTSGYKTYGIGHNRLSSSDSIDSSLDYWKEDNISLKAILEFKSDFDTIVHCGGSGSVRFSIDHEAEDYKRTVDGTLEVLEYMKIHNPKAYLIYPSSPAVQGEHLDEPRKEEYIGTPVSPYGDHKKITEDLCQSFSKEFGLNISIIRLFSVYGNGLKKQLLWDACNKILNANKEAIFWGSGEEVRDFIHISDVMSLFDMILNARDKFLIINGGTGIRNTVRDVVEIIRDSIDPNISISFNNQKDVGNPIYYYADTQKLTKYGYKVRTNLQQEVKTYIEWVKSLND